MEEVTFEPGLEQFGREDAFSGEKILEAKAWCWESVHLVIQIHSVLGSCRRCWHVLGHVGLVQVPESLCSSNPCRNRAFLHVPVRF